MLGDRSMCSLCFPQPNFQPRLKIESLISIVIIEKTPVLVSDKGMKFLFENKRNLKCHDITVTFPVLITKAGSNVIVLVR